MEILRNKTLQIRTKKTMLVHDKVTSWNILEVDLENKIIKVNDTLVVVGDLPKDSI